MLYDTVQSGEPAQTSLEGMQWANSGEASKNGNVPCPRRFGANFSPNGTLVVFSSATIALRVRTDAGSGQGRDACRSRKQVMQ